MVSVQYRMVPVYTLSQVKEALLPGDCQFLASKTIAVTRAKGILDVRLTVVWDKESAVKWITAKEKNPDARRANPEE